MNRTIFAIATGAFVALAISAAQAGPAWGPPGWQNGPPDPCGPNLCKPQPQCHTVYEHECVNWQPSMYADLPPHCTQYESVPHEVCS